MVSLLGNEQNTIFSGFMILIWFYSCHLYFLVMQSTVLYIKKEFFLHSTEAFSCASSLKAKRKEICLNRHFNGNKWDARWTSRKRQSKDGTSPWLMPTSPLLGTGNRALGKDVDWLTEQKLPSKAWKSFLLSNQKLWGWAVVGKM